MLDDAIEYLGKKDISFLKGTNPANPVFSERPERYSITDVIKSFIFLLRMVIHGYPEKTV